MKKKIPVLITLDVHPDKDMPDYIGCALKELERMGIRATFFITAAVLKENKELAKKILKDGHQIGSHGLFHNDSIFKGFPAERYDILDESMQARFIEQSTQILEEATGEKITCFRSPLFRLSQITLNLLQQYGYRADFSVNSQRLDLLSSDPFTFKNTLAPRLPYHPNLNNPFKKGYSKIWEIPLSSLVFPFAIMTLMSIGLKMTKLLFKIFYKESLINNKPIVYMAHPEEFYPESNRIYRISFNKLRLKDFLPMKKSGIQARMAFRMSSPSKICHANVRLLEYMKNFKDVIFVTADEYINSWLM